MDLNSDTKELLPSYFEATETMPPTNIPHPHQATAPQMYSPQQQPMAPYPQYYAPQHQAPPQTQQPTVLATNTIITTQPQVVFVGGCPSCRSGTMRNSFTCCGICCAIVCFPVGIICCFAMREKRCSNCGA